MFFWRILFVEIAKVKGAPGFCGCRVQPRRFTAPWAIVWVVKKFANNKLVVPAATTL